MDVVNALKPFLGEILAEYAQDDAGEPGVGLSPRAGSSVVAVMAAFLGRGWP